VATCTGALKFVAVFCYLLVQQPCVVLRYRFFLPLTHAFILLLVPPGLLIN
jgi:hypothetical protein